MCLVIESSEYKQNVCQSIDMQTIPVSIVTDDQECIPTGVCALTSGGPEHDQEVGLSVRTHKTSVSAFKSIST